MTLFCVASGAALGAALRFVLGHVLDTRVPWGTLLVNLVGSFLLGALSGAALSGAAFALLGVGFCGALTTYSAFAVQAWERGRVQGTLYALMTVPPALAACFLGHWLTS